VTKQFTTFSPLVDNLTTIGPSLDVMKLLRHLLTAVLGSLILATVSSQAASNTTATLYVHFGFESSDSTKRLLSTRTHLGEPIFVGGEDIGC
jgi:hypothetical protein